MGGLSRVVDNFVGTDESEPEDNLLKRLLMQAPPWLISAAGHMMLFILVALIPYQVATRGGRSTTFESIDQNEFQETEVPRFELKSAPLDPSELNTETLMQWEEKPIARNGSAQRLQSGIRESAGGGIPDGTLTGAGLGLEISATGLGPIGHGAGGVDVGAGLGQQAGRGGAGTGFGLRGSGNREAIPGVTKASERAVGTALNWISRHQNRDGGWSIASGDRRPCTDASCRGWGTTHADAAATALAILPFLGAGQTHETKGSPYQKHIQRGLTWLVQHQNLEGDLSGGQHQMYSHGLATMALCETYGMTKDSKFGHAAQLAIKFIESGQNDEGGWRYNWRSYEGDTSVFGWQVMALKSAQMAGLQVDQQKFQRCKKWLEQCSSGYHKGIFSYQPGNGPKYSMTAVGFLATEYLGANQKDQGVKESMDYLLENMPSNDKRDIYYWYYATLALHNVPGPEWEKWNRQMRRLLIESQVDHGCATGSWSPADDEWGSLGGRLMVTSLSALTLEVYYRYLPLYQLDIAKPPATTPVKAEKEKTEKTE